jgi:hypothetical protein
MRGGCYGACNDLVGGGNGCSRGDEWKEAQAGLVVGWMTKSY